MLRGKGDKRGTQTHDALVSKLAAKRAHEEELAKAVALHASGAGGSRVLCGKVLGCSYQQIDRAIAKSMLEQAPRPQWAILTDIEGEALVKWLLLSAQNDNPATEREVSVQVTKMLQVRRLYNRKHQTGKLSASLVPLSLAEVRLAVEGGVLSHKWYAGFYAAHPSVQLKCAHGQLLYHGTPHITSVGTCEYIWTESVPKAELPLYNLVKKKRPGGPRLVNKLWFGYGYARGKLPLQPLGTAY